MKQREQEWASPKTGLLQFYFASRVHNVCLHIITRAFVLPFSYEPEEAAKIWGTGDVSRTVPRCVVNNPVVIEDVYLGGIYFTVSVE